MDAAPSAYLLLAVRRNTKKDESTQTNEEILNRTANLTLTEGKEEKEDVPKEEDQELELSRQNYFKAHVEGIEHAEVISYYNTWAKRYDGDMKKISYNGPAIMGDIMNRYYGREVRPNARILDVAAGTGLVGEVLARYGFKLIDAVEPSKGMIDALESKGIYHRAYKSSIGFHPIPGIRADSYDAVVMVGGMGESHVPLRALDEILRIVRPGGMVFIGMKREYLSTIDEYKDGRLIQYMRMLCYKGLWFKVMTTVVNDFVLGEEGVIFCSQKAET